MKLKQLNTELVKKALRANGDGTKNSIADETGLSVSTCRNILEELVASGEVIEVDSAPSTGGRPSRRFEYNEHYNYLLLMYVSIENREECIHCSVANMMGTPVYEENFSFQGMLIDELDDVVNAMLEKFKNISVISIGIPGVVNDGVIDSCDIDSLAGFDMKRHVARKFGIAVTVENDVNSAAMGYYKNMNADEPESLVYIFYPNDYCAGAGIVINGRVLKGKSCFAGEVGYMPGMSCGENNGKQTFIDIAVKTVLIINCIINPDCIVITGNFITDEIKDNIKNLVASESRPHHVPSIDFESEMHENYIHGLFFAGMERLSCDLKVVKRY